MIATRLGGAGDIRKVGSGNIGATNVLRTGRRDLALITLIGDAGKGAAAVLIADALVGPAGAAIAGGAAFLGHLFPDLAEVSRRQGRGDLLRHPAGHRAGRPGSPLAVWIAMAAIFRISSLAALVAAALRR